MTWQDDAACRGSDVDFFPPQGQKGDSPTFLRAAQPALGLCSVCPVIDECRGWIMAETVYADLVTDHGIWAGTTPSQREAIRRANPDRVRLADCTVCGVEFEAKRGQTLCTDECRAEAKRRTMAAYHRRGGRRVAS